MDERVFSKRRDIALYIAPFFSKGAIRIGVFERISPFIAHIAPYSAFFDFSSIHERKIDTKRSVLGGVGKAYRT